MNIVLEIILNGVYFISKINYYRSLVPWKKKFCTIFIYFGILPYHLLVIDSKQAAFCVPLSKKNNVDVKLYYKLNVFLFTETDTNF